MRLSLLIVLLLWVCCAGIAPAMEPADLVLTNGPVHTSDERKSNGRAVAIKDGRIVFVGNQAAIRRFIGPATRQIDLKGACVLPGLTDAHMHLAGVGARELTLNLEGSASIQDVVDRLAAYASAHPNERTLLGRGWIETHWPERRFLTARDLDQVSDGRPVVLTRADGHAVTVNSAALAKAGISRATSDPDGGRIERDGDGTPTGLLIDHAMSLIEPLVPPIDPARMRLMVETGARVYAAMGWTAVHAMSVSADELAAAIDLAKAGRLPIRVYAALNLEAMEGRLDQKLFSTDPIVDTHGLVVARAVKLYADGALGSRGAALLEPYSDAPGSGLMLIDRERAMPILIRMLQSGVQVATHAIGDRGNRLTLDWYAAAFDAVPPGMRLVAEPRWRIEHAQILAASDIDRFGRLGVIASMQPSHAIGDLYFAPSRLGADRLKGAYAWASLLKSGAVIAGGSDAPVERGNPLIEFYAAVARRDLTGFQDAKTWHGEQAIDRETALKMFSLWPAQAAFAEAELGSITLGKRADLTILDQDILRIPVDQIPKTRALMTLVDGEVRYRAKDFGG